MELYTGFVTSSCFGDKQVFERFLLAKVFRWSFTHSFNKLCSTCRYQIM